MKLERYSQSRDKNAAADMLVSLDKDNAIESHRRKHFVLLPNTSIQSLTKYAIVKPFWKLAIKRKVLVSSY